MKILLVDDDIEELTLFSHAIERLGVPITLVYIKGSRELFQYLEKDQDVNLIFLDINMPKVNGKQCLKLLKSDQRFYHIPVLIYSVSQSIQDIDEAFEDGAHYFAIKPYAPINFLETLRLIFDINWLEEQPIPLREQFVINRAFV